MAGCACQDFVAARELRRQGDIQGQDGAVLRRDNLEWLAVVLLKLFVWGRCAGHMKRDLDICIGTGAIQILRRVEEGVDKPRPKVLFEPGEVVRVTNGPFNDFNGVVENVNYEKSRLQVAVQILGRSTPVELEFSQVEKA